MLLDVPNAKIPAMVRLDLSTIPLSYFYVKENDAGATLGYGAQNGEFTTLAIFTSKEDAHHALKLITRSGFWGASLLNFAARVATVLLLIIAALWVLNQALLFTLYPSTSSPVSSPQPSGENSAPVHGMPMDADQKLGNQE